jgi:hypothetical protein
MGRAGMRLQLGQTWMLGERIGGGGFGAVHIAESADQASAVAKLVPKAPGAERELLFVELAGVRNVVPIIDSGETEEHWVLVMPRADKSLRQHMIEAAGPFGPEETISILSDITDALVDLDGQVVHRDLKPENVLLLDGHWCLADFGISRYADATTAPDTRKHAFSPPYCAPERWRDERATTATDVYSLGVIAFELLSSSRPFVGPTDEDLREQHLHQAPPPLAAVPAALGALIDECLAKAPGARPHPGNLAARLARVTEATPSAGLAKLQEANRAEVRQRGETARRESEQQSEAERREDLIKAASPSLAQVTGALKEAIVEAAPSASHQVGRDGGWSIRLNRAELQLTARNDVRSAAWGAWGHPPFDVIAYATLVLSISADRHEYEGRSHSLWYCDAQEKGYYQWFETAFMVTPLLGKRARKDPFALSPGDDSAKAVGPGMTEYQVAWPFMAFSIGDLDEFINRWAGWFADAAQGQLRHPSSMPERSPQGSWRRS